ncbi:hypothetical protein F4778DRAFT_279176 [Xylariomycetidae sp. FL2044]|nr:hypothetical protein F4778DRAFT_279176 [Xylariomycetidae sp. FL2044]
MADSSIRSSVGPGGSLNERMRRARGQGPGGLRNPSARLSAVYGEDTLQTPRNSSARSSASYADDPLRTPTYQPGQGNPYDYGSLGLRSTSSRFSLNEQFAATRREIEFEYDDASSILERSTIASQPLDELFADETILVGGPVEGDEDASYEPPIGNFYDALCVSREPSPESIRRAYFRLFTLFHPDLHPPNYRRAAEHYFGAIQTAFETLMDPCRRFKYDLDRHDDQDTLTSPSEEEKYLDYLRWHAILMRHQILYPDDSTGTWELGARFDAQSVMQPPNPHGPRQRRRPPQPLDFEMSHSLSIDLPQLDSILRRRGRVIRESSFARYFNFPNIDGLDTSGFYQGATRPYSVPRGTTLSVRGSVYGFLQDLASAPFSLLFDHYQPSFPAALSRGQFTQMHDGRVYPSISAKLRHRLLSTSTEDSCGRAHGVPYPYSSTREDRSTIIEIDTDLLPIPAVAAGVSKPVTLPWDRHRSLLHLAAKSDLRNRGRPRLWSSLQRPTAGGLLSIGIDSGDWHHQLRETCRYFSDFSKINKRFLSLDYPFYKPPRIELGYKLKSSTFAPRISRIPDRPFDYGMRGMDWSLDNDADRTWTASATAERNFQTCSIRYAHDLRLPSLRTCQALALQSDSSNARKARAACRKVHVEAEISSSSFWTGYLAIRCLKRVGRFSKFGFEIGLSTHSLHLAVYWSRLGQRVSLPFVMASRANLSTDVLFWTTFVPFASFAAWEFCSDYFRSRKQHRQQRDDKSLETETEKQNAGDPDLDPADALLQRRRAAADQVALLMWSGVQNRQRAEHAENGLVILDAKYGVKAAPDQDQGQDAAGNAWGAEEVADVTVAVAALVDQGRLRIPRGVRKGHILGFWDPDPAGEKALHVRYTFRGREATVEVRGDEEELILPPPPPPSTC